MLHVDKECQGKHTYISIAIEKLKVELPNDQGDPIQLELVKAKWIPAFHFFDDEEPLQGKATLDPPLQGEPRIPAFLLAP